MARTRTVALSYAVMVLFSTTLLRAAANTVPVSDPQAILYAGQALQALTNGAPVADVTISGNVSWIAGSITETGTGMFRGKGVSESKSEFALTSGSRTDVRNGTSGVPLGNWFGPDGVVHKYAAHNAWTDAIWFFPVLSSLTQPSSSNVILKYVGKEMRGGVSVFHIQSYVYAAGKDAFTISRIQTMSGMDFYLDSVSLLPVSVVFSAHPDNDTNTNMAVEVDFSNYQSVNGIQIPYHIQRFFQGTLQIDFAVTNAVINSGLSDDIFTIQ